jgi:NADPH:quinone reductase-like Zn-dependent oxidoreductase
MPQPTTARGVTFIVAPRREQLVEIASLVDAGALRPIVDTVLPLARARDAHERGRSGHTRRKIVLEVLA